MEKRRERERFSSILMIVFNTYNNTVPSNVNTMTNYSCIDDCIVTNYGIVTNLQRIECSTERDREKRNSRFDVIDDSKL